MNPSDDLPKLSSLSREKLYDLVWTEVMATLAKLGMPKPRHPDTVKRVLGQVAEWQEG